MNSNDDEKKFNLMLKDGLVNSDIYMNNIGLSELKQKKDDKILNFPCKKFIVNGNLYITKELYNKKHSKAEDLIKFKMFSEYFSNVKYIRETNRDEKLKIKKNSNRSKDVKNIEMKNDISDSEEYEVEYVEKMKKNQNTKIHMKQLNSTLGYQFQ
jgi:hypothetical protein